MSPLRVAVNASVPLAPRGPAKKTMPSRAKRACQTPVGSARPVVRGMSAAVRRRVQRPASADGTAGVAATVTCEAVPTVLPRVVTRRTARRWLPRARIHGCSALWSSLNTNGAWRSVHRRRPSMRKSTRVTGSVDCTPAGTAVHWSAPTRVAPSLIEDTTRSGRGAPCGPGPQLASESANAIAVAAACVGMVRPSASRRPLARRSQSAGIGPRGRRRVVR
jgi:hypothetical protein